MEHNEKLTRYTANFVDELAASGVVHVVISPGSRSTPLAMLCKAHKKMQEWILVDERSAAYFALGLAKKSLKPVALVCTSGTAAANYFPAIVEAYYARVPLIVLTADRPHELRGIGAPQTIQQIQLYGNYVKDFQEMALPDASGMMLSYVRNRAGRAVRIAQQENPGPVHLNFPFREPLVPNFQLESIWGKADQSYNPLVEGKSSLLEPDLLALATKLSGQKNGLIVCGPQPDRKLIEPLIQLSEKLQIPILADPLSQLRAGEHSKATIITSYDAIFRHKTFRDKLQPDYIIRFGAMPVSKSYRFFVEEHAACAQYVVEHGKEVREPINHPSEYLIVDSVALCEDLVQVIQEKQQNDWLNTWLEMETIAREELQIVSSPTLTEGEAVRMVSENLLDQSDIFISNSMPVRDLDTFFLPSEKEISVYGNRGTSGIDGVTSTALGIAAVSEKPVTLIIGDLSFYHDLNGLLASKQYNISLTIVLINNDGGGIFSFLPQAREKEHFEDLFGTPLGLDFKKAVTMYGGKFVRVAGDEDFKKAFQQAHDDHGLTVIEVMTDRDDNVHWHQEVWNTIGQRLHVING